MFLNLASAPAFLHCIATVGFEGGRSQEEEGIPASMAQCSPIHSLLGATAFATANPKQSTGFQVP